MTKDITALIAELNEKREKVKDLPISLDIGDSSQRYVHIINANDQTVFYKYDASAPGPHNTHGRDCDWGKLVVAAVNSVPILAAEIAQLEGDRDALAEIQRVSTETITRLQNVNRAKEAEVSRLREALTSVLWTKPSYAPDGDKPDLARVLLRINEIARAALQQQAEEIG